MWQDEALCNGADTARYFDFYEDDLELASNVDRMCVACPVIKECFASGVSTESWGVWGGVYLVDGKIDNPRNAHKTEEMWNRILELIK